MMALIIALVFAVTIEVAVILKASRKLISPLHGPLPLASSHKDRVKKTFDWMFRFGSIWAIYLFFGVFFLTAGGNLANITLGLKIDSASFVNLGTVGIVIVAVGRMLTLTYSGFMVQSFVFTVVAALFLLIVQYIYEPASLVFLTDNVIEAKNTGVIQEVAVASLVLAVVVEIALWIGNRLGYLRSVPVSLFTELQNIIREHDQYLHRSQVTRISIERIRARATMDEKLDLLWVTISADTQILKTIKEYEEKWKGKVTVKLITTKLDEASQRVFKCDFGKCDVLLLSGDDIVHTRFIVINGREVVKSVSVPSRNTSGSVELPEGSVDWSNVAHVSTDLDTVASYAGQFKDLWSTVESRSN